MKEPGGCIQSSTPVQSSDPINHSILDTRTPDTQQGPEPTCSPVYMRTTLNDRRWRWAGNQMLMTGCPSLVPKGCWWRAEFHLWSQLPLARLWKPSECTHLQGKGMVWVSFRQQYLNSFKFNFLSGEIFFWRGRKRTQDVHGHLRGRGWYGEGAYKAGLGRHGATDP